MNKMKICGSIIIFICMLSASAVAGDFDGSKPLLCAVMDIVECGPDGNCQKVMAEEVGSPVRYLVVGEDLDDLSDFDAGAFVEALFASD